MPRTTLGMWLALDSVARCAAAWQRDRGHCAAERERAQAIATAPRRAQFLGGRWLAAQCLAAQHGGDAAAWQMACTPGQAPRVLDGPTAKRPWLSLAHRGDVLACALADRPVGVDVEVLGRMRGAPDERAELMLAPIELAHYAGVPPAEREALLLSHWTLKEAWAKRGGHGLSLGGMPELAAQQVARGGNARLWHAGGLVVALCADADAAWPQPRGQGLDAVEAQAWQVGALDAPR